MEPDDGETLKTLQIDTLTKPLVQLQTRFSSPKAAAMLKCTLHSLQFIRSRCHERERSQALAAAVAIVLICFSAQDRIRRTGSRLGSIRNPLQVVSDLMSDPVGNCEGGPADLADVSMLDGNFTRKYTTKAPENVRHVGQSVFVDFGESDEQINTHTVNPKSEGKKNQRQERNKEGKTEKNKRQERQERTTGRHYPGVFSADWVSGPCPPPWRCEFHSLITLHTGDYNLDGFPDALAILRNTSNSAQQQAFLLENVACSNASCRDAGRMFRVHWDQPDLNAIPKAAVATFFDIYEDGILDMMVLSRTEGKKELSIHALKNNFEADAYFVKVIELIRNSALALSALAHADKVALLILARRKTSLLLHKTGPNHPLIHSHTNSNWRFN
ncbi:T-cell immunomodulatory protein [Bagarius yarrelli]|uniref:T-cell immunomodulatory protein n=1 Tax=Bagarius yarrelli TaxID=175774 RepID=A0A556VWG8_BAGYA|nr:T-cell immunomodulatory protein [Bagarius yarrelli]